MALGVLATASGPWLWLTMAAAQKEPTISAQGVMTYPGRVVVSIPGFTTPDPARIVSKVQKPGTVISEGAVVAEIAGRPVIALEGDLPMFRTLQQGAVGTDVAELEKALTRLGLLGSPPDNRYDAATRDAVAALYRSTGYSLPADDVGLAESTRNAQIAVNDARSRYNEVNRALELAVRTAAEAAAAKAREAATASTTQAESQARVDSAETDLSLLTQADRIEIAQADAVVQAAQNRVAVVENRVALARIDDANTQAELLAAAKQYQVTIDKTARAIRDENVRLESARADRVAAEANVESARADVADLRRPPALPAGSPSTLPPTAIQVREGETRVRFAESALRAQTAAVARSESEIAAQNADLAIAQDALTRTNTRIGVGGRSTRDAELELTTARTDLETARRSAQATRGRIELSQRRAAAALQAAAAAASRRAGSTTASVPLTGSEIDEQAAELANQRIALAEDQLAVIESTLPVAEIVFLPRLPARIDAYPAVLGRPLSGTLLEATGVVPEVTVSAPVSDAPRIAVGSPTSVSTGGRKFKGRVADVTVDGPGATVRVTLNEVPAVRVDGAVATVQIRLVAPQATPPDEAAAGGTELVFEPGVRVDSAAASNDPGTGANVVASESSESSESSGSSEFWSPVVSGSATGSTSGTTEPSGTSTLGPRTKSRSPMFLALAVELVLLGIILLVFATRRRPVHLRDQLDRRHQRQKAQRGFELDQEGAGLVVGDPAADLGVGESAGPDLGVGDGGDAAGDPASGRPAPETLGLVALAPDARFASAASGEHDG